MANKEKYWDLLQDYARGTLSKEDQLDLEKWLASNEDAKATVDGFRQLDSTYNNEADVSNYHHQRSAAILENIKTSEKTNYKWYLVAASLVFTALSIYLISYFLKSEPQFEALLEEYTTEHYQMSRVRGSEGFSGWQDHYKARNYALVISTINSSSEPKSQFFKALSHLYLQEYKAAIPILENQLKEETEFQENSRWYLALAYLNIDQTEKGFILLKEIAASQRHFNQSKAKNLISAYKTEK